MFLVRTFVHNTWYYLCQDNDNVTFLFPMAGEARLFPSRAHARGWIGEVASLPVCRHLTLELVRA